MHYVMSDIHGRHDLFLRMLEQISFSENDTLYLLGDLIDRGPDGIKLLQDVMDRPNVIPFLGNHEDMFYRVIRKIGKSCTAEERSELMEALFVWTRYNGGDVTWADYRALSPAQRAAILDYLETFTVYDEVRVGENTFLLAHAGVGAWEPEKDPESCTLHDFLWAETDYDRVYYKDKYLITGHTPTGMIDPALTGRIIRKNNHIALDCGAVFCGTLGCLCLETMEEIYVSSDDVRPSASEAAIDLE